MVRTPHTDEVLLSARDGDRAALRVLYERLAPAVLGYLTARGVANPELVTSDIFVNAFKRLDAITGGTARLCTVVFSAAFERVVDESRPGPAHRALVACRPDVRASSAAAARAARQVDTARVVALVNRLAPGQRDVLLLRVVAGLTITQAAEITQRSRVAVKQLQHRGRVALRTLLVLDAERADER
jgi:RNA polymerase sigma-70 factor (ECF subfamily)